MKKTLSVLMIVLLALSLLGRNSNEFQSHITIGSFDIFEYYFISKGTVVSIDETELKAAGYEYDDLVYHADHEDVVNFIYTGDIKAKNPGMTWVTATMFKDGLPVTNVAIGCFIIIDLESENFVQLNSYSEFMSEISDNPGGNYYLGNDIVFPGDGSHAAIDEFSGMLINPYGYRIYGLQDDQAIFDVLERAYVDGIIIEDFILDGGVLGSLASMASYSLIVNTHVENTSLTCTVDCGGIVGTSFHSIFDYVSFEGQIDMTGVGNAGGLIGSMMSVNKDYKFYQEHFISNSYAMADITETSDGASVYISGLVGYVDGYALIESSYTTGNLSGDITSQISYNRNNDEVYYISVYTTYPVNYDSMDEYGEYDLNYLTEAELITGTVLPGLENFTYEVGEIPKN